MIQSFVHLLVLSISLSISIIDLKTHRIPNKLNIGLFISLILEKNSLSLLPTLLTALIATMVTLSCSIGMGDLKLFLVLLITQGQHIFLSEYLFGFSICALLLTTYALVKGRSFRVAVPLAPAFLAPFLALYFAHSSPLFGN